MDAETFYLEELEFIDEVRASPCYKRMIALSDEIDEDDEIRELAERRDSLYERISNEPSGTEELLKSAKEIDDLIGEKEIVKEYRECRRELKRILRVIEDEILMVTK